jgi:predicted aminopeptidase
MGRRLHKHLVDAAVDAYADWREECLAVQDAYDRWMNAPISDARWAFVAYRAALDREERASETYADLAVRA